MSHTITQTESITFTITNAKYLASKVAADLKRIQRFYEYPTDDWIIKYEEELTLLLKNGYLKKMTYGFRRDNNWICPTLSYSAIDLQNMQGTDDDPGRITIGAETGGATFGSFFEPSTKFENLSSDEKQRFNGTRPFDRGFGSTPGAVGYFSGDLSYSSGGRSLNRSTLKSLSL